MKLSKKWERIEACDWGLNSSVCERLQVVGGWIVRTIVDKADRGICVHHIFVADSTHLWEFGREVWER
jgi:hypothetical protein